MSNTACTSATCVHSRRSHHDRGALHRTLAFAVIGVGGCLGGPPSVGPDDDTATSTGSSGSQPSGPSPSGSSEAPEDASTAIDDTGTSGTDTEGGESSTSSSSSGGLPLCDCSPTAALCESFEGDFELVDPWGSSTVGAPDPAITKRSASCGDAALEASAEIGTEYVQAIVTVPPGTISQDLVSLHLAVRPGAGCLEQGPVRVAEIQFIDSGVVYFVGLWLSDGTVDVTIQRPAGGTQGNVLDVAQIADGTWTIFDVEIDFATPQPGVQAWVDGEHVFAGASDLTVDGDPSAFMPHLSLGAYLGGPLFESDCAVAIDDVWIADGGVESS